MSEKNNNNIQQPADKLLKTAGEILRQARTEQGLSEAFVCSSLGLTTASLRALEEDDYQRLPAPVYIKGYIRRYCKLLQIRVNPVLAGYENYLGDSSERVSDQETQLPVKQPLAVMLGSVCAFILVSIVMFWAIYSEGTEIPGERDYQPQVVVKSPSSKNQSADSVNFPLSMGREVVKSLVFTFETDSWVKVVDAKDQILVVDLYRKGQHLALNGEPPFAIVLGHGPGVSISYLGEAVEIEAHPETFAAELIVGQ